MALSKSKDESKSQPLTKPVRSCSVVYGLVKEQRWKQITTHIAQRGNLPTLFMALSKSKDESKSQRCRGAGSGCKGCLWPCQRAKMKANHNILNNSTCTDSVVYGLVKEQRWKQITTGTFLKPLLEGCLWPCQRAKMKANHNQYSDLIIQEWVVYGLVKEQRWKQITTQPM